MTQTNTKADKQPPKGAREVLITTGTRLMAEHGIEGVSLNQIVKAAGQRNSSAAQYHFGSKAGLIQAIFDKHSPGIQERRQKLLEKLNRTSGLEEIVHALVYPMAEELNNPDGGRDFLLFLASTRHHGLTPSGSALDQAPRQQVAAIFNLLRQKVGAVPAREAKFRQNALHNLLLFSLADYSRELQAGRKESAADRQYFVDCLIGSICAVLSAPAFG